MNKLSQKSGLLSRIDGRLLKLFYGNPVTKYTVREIAKLIKISKSTAQNQLMILREIGVISKDNEWVDNWINRYYKSSYYVEMIINSGLIDYLDQELVASSIILFGSFRKGESIKSSDIDIFVECTKEKSLDLKKYERMLGHKIEIFMKPKITMLPKGLLNNVVNGIKLKGYFTIK